MIEVLKKFRPKDSLGRAWMDEVHQMGDWMVVTDSWRIIREKGQITEEIHHPMTNETANVINEYYEHERINPKVVNCKEVLSQFKKRQKEPQYKDDEIECETCEGEGEVQYEFNHKGNYYERDEECPVCEGDGVITGKTKEIIGYDFPTGTLLMVDDGMYVNPSLLIDFLREGETITLYNSGNKAVFGIIDETYEIILMRHLYKENVHKENLMILDDLINKTTPS